MDKSSTLQNRSNIKNLESCKVEVLLYSACSDLKKIRTFSSLEELSDWLEHFKDRSFNLDFYQGKIRIFLRGFVRSCILIRLLPIQT